MAYFQMDKNPIKELETEENYKNWAKGCYRQAEMFYRLCYRCRDMLLSEEMDAVYTNIAFACELYFKCLLFEQQIDCRKEHDLYKLYKSMPEQLQKGIKEIHPCGNTPKPNFELELKEVGKAFTVFRYMYERKMVAWNGQFLVELLDILHQNIVDNQGE